MNRKPFPRELRRFFVLAATCIRVSWSLFIFPVPRRKNGRINGHYLVAAAGKLRGTSGHRPFFTLLGGCFDNPSSPLRSFNGAEHKDFFVCIFK